ncbi:DUF4013 domain-containing protein [Methanobrevibacter sp.]|uniref:DUF4013 domain-containing protein n=1 Tax=Methanobrevibacter sp. TaxID=66852 RepID=UPI00388DF7DD
MEIGDIVSQALKYPLSDTTAFFKVAAMYLLLLVPILLITLGVFAESSGAAAVGIILLAVCNIIFILIMNGFHISVLKEGIDESESIPPFEIGKNIVNTFKSIVLSFVYGIIPGIIITIMFVVLGISVSPNGSSSGILGAGIFIVFIVSIILYIIFGLLLLVGMLRLANTDSLSEGLNFSAVIEDLKGIGVGKIIVTWIIFGVIATVIVVVGLFLSIIPIIGPIILLIFILPYVFLAVPYGCGLLYSEIA